MYVANRTGSLCFGMHTIHDCGEFLAVCGGDGERTSFVLAILGFLLVDAFCDSWRAVLMAVFFVRCEERVR